MTEEKKLEELTPEEIKELKVVFAPGCFDNFDGTQEELDEFMTEIKRLIESGEFVEKSRPLDLESLEEEDPEIADQIYQAIQNSDRKLH